MCLCHFWQDDLKHGHGKFVWPDGHSPGLVGYFVVLLKRNSPVKGFEMRQERQAGPMTVSGAKANVMAWCPRRLFHLHSFGEISQ